MHIGIIEDNPAIVEVYTLTFEMQGHTTATYTTGEAFFERYSSEEGRILPLPYSALIIDLGLPGPLSGQEVIHRLMQERTEEHLPFLVVVSGAATSVLSSLREAFPMLIIIQKPLSIPALLSQLEQRAFVSSARRDQKKEARISES